MTFDERGLAEEALSNLRYARDSLVGTRDDRLLDGTYTRADGRLDIGALTDCFDAAEYDKSWEAENAPVATRTAHAGGDDAGLTFARRSLPLRLKQRRPPTRRCASNQVLRPEVSHVLGDQGR